MDQKMIVGIVIAAIVIGGASFYGGMQYSQMTRANRVAQGANGAQGGQFFARNGQGARGGANGGFALGTVLSKDASGITIQLTQPGGANGQAAGTQGTGSKIILVNASTQIMKTTSGSSDDLTSGETVMVQGTQNSDGSITAQSIQIRPASAAPRDQLNK